VIYSTTVNYDLEWANLVSATSYSTLHETAVVDLTDAFGPLLGPSLGIANPGFSVGSNLYLRKTTQELRLESPEGSLLEWRGGLFFTHEHSDRDEPSTVFLTGSQAVVPLPEPIFFADLDSRYTEYAGFGDVTYHFTRQFDLAAGLRYSTNEQRFNEISGGLGSANTITSQGSSDNSTTFLVTPRFRLDDNNMIYARVGSGYRPGGPNSVTPAETAVGVPSAYKPDTLTDYDIGYKASLFERRLTLDLSAFYIDWKNIQIETEYSGITSSGNGGTASSEGLEASAVLTPLHGWTVSLNFAYTDAHLTEDAPGVNGRSGDELPNVPKWSAGLSTDYDFTLTGKVAAFVGGGVHYVGERVSGFVTGSPADFVRPLIPSYTTVDLRTGVNYGLYTFELYAKNVGNERGFNNVSSLSLSAYQAPFTASVIQPRTVGLSMIARF
jgi:iron complex outermembrane recepter protein